MPSGDSSVGAFTLRHDDSMGCYRVSVPNLAGPVRVVPVAEVVEAIRSMPIETRGTGTDRVTIVPSRRAIADYIEAVFSS